MVYRASILRGLAITQMIIGALLFIFGWAVFLAVDHWTTKVSFGSWIGMWVIVTGIMGYHGAKDNSVPNKCAIGIFMGFSITSCVLTSGMFTVYCIALSEFSSRLRCPYSDYDNYHYVSSDCYRVNDLKRETARNGIGLGSCVLLFALVEFFVALASSIFCRNVVCCSSPSPTQQVTFVPAQPMGQSGAVVVQPTGQVTSLQTVYPSSMQQPMYMPPQPMQQIPPGYWQPAEAVPVSYPAVGTPQAQAPAQPYKPSDVPPPYSKPMGGAVPPDTSDVAAPTTHF